MKIAVRGHLPAISRLTAALESAVRDRTGQLVRSVIAEIWATRFEAGS